MKANGTKIKELRETQGVTTLELASAADRTQRWVQLVEQGKMVNVNLNILKAVAKKLGTKLEVIAK
jgi:transcriptional regulator with XRE-family HTH domain